MNSFVETTKSVFATVRRVFQKIEEVISVIYRCIFRLRKIFMAIPVVYLAIKIARENMERLPEAVGLNIQSNGEFAVMVTRNYAVYGPLAITGFCLLLMFCSRKTVYPWVISIFTLILPYFIYLTNLIPL